MKVMQLLVLGLLFPIQANAQRQRHYEKEASDMPTVHSWISTTGNGFLPGSWDTGEPPAVVAVGVLTLTGQPLNGEQVVLDTKTYTFQETLTDVDGNVHISHVDASGSLDNLIAAITLGAGAGTAYANSMTLHPTVTAVAGAGDTMDVTAKSKGTDGNGLSSTETLTNGSFGGATLSGGTQWDSNDQGYFNADNGGVAWSSGVDFSEIPDLGASMVVEDNWDYDFGASGSPLRLGLSKLSFNGNKTCYFVGRDGSPGTAVIVNSFNGRVVLGDAGDGSFYAPLMIKEGDVIVTGGASTDVYDIHLTGVSARLEIDDSAVTLLGHFVMRDGSAHIVPNILANKTIEVHAGLLNMLGRVVTAGRISVTGGVMVYRPYDTTPTTPDLYVDGGIVDLSKSLVLLTSADFGTTIIGPRGHVVGGALGRDAIWPPDFDLRQVHP